MHRAVDAKVIRIARGSQIHVRQTFGCERVIQDGVQQAQAEIAGHLRIPTRIGEVGHCSGHIQNVLFFAGRAFSDAQGANDRARAGYVDGSLQVRGESRSRGGLAASQQVKVANAGVDTV